MPLKAGNPVLHGDIAETRDAADGVEIGDAVAIDDASGDLVAVDTDANELAGIVGRHAYDSRLHLSGAIVAAVAEDVSAGARLDGGNATGTSTGVLVESAGGPALALSDEGGEWQGMPVPEGYAVVMI